MISRRAIAATLFPPVLALSAACASTGRVGRLETEVDKLAKSNAGLTQTVENISRRTLSEHPYTFTREHNSKEFAYLMALAFSAYSDKERAKTALEHANSVLVSPLASGIYSVIPVYDVNGDSQTTQNIDRVYTDFEGGREVTGFQVAPGFLPDFITTKLAVEPPRQ